MRSLALLALLACAAPAPPEPKPLEPLAKGMWHVHLDGDTEYIAPAEVRIDDGTLTVVAKGPAMLDYMIPPTGWSIRRSPVEIHTWTVDEGRNERAYSHAFHPASGASSFPRMGGRLDDAELERSRYEIRQGHYLGHRWHPGCWRAGP